MNAGEGENGRANGHYRFDDVVVDAAAHTLMRGGQLQPIEPKTFAVLLALLRRPGEMIGRDELLDAVWGHRHVTPGVLTRAIAQLRHALGDDSQRPRYVQTQHALGYRFIGTLETRSIAPRPEIESAYLTSLLPDVSEDAVINESAGDSIPQAAQGSYAERSRPATVDPVKVDPLDAYDESRSPAKRTRNWALAATLLVTAVLIASLWDWSASDPAATDASVVVMPFRNLSDNRDDDYFAEGLAVEMHDALAGVQGLKVAAQMSPAASNARDADVKAVGKRLGVATVLHASVRRGGQSVRINAVLSDTSTGYTLWSHSYDRELSDVFATQIEIADEVVRSLMGVLPQQRETLVKRLQPTKNVAAFDFYLRGLQSLRRASGNDHGESAIGFFSTALAKDGNFARAQAAICMAEARRFEYWHDSGAYGRARSACARAREMDPESGEAVLALGNLHRVRGEYAEALGQYRKIADDPAVAPKAHVGMAKAYAAQGRKDLAQQNFQRALALRPGDAITHTEVGFQAYRDGRIGDAIAEYRKALALDPDNAGGWNTLGFFHLVATEDAEATRAFERSIAIKPNADAIGNLGALKFNSGDYAAATAFYRKATELDPEDHVNWGNLGEGLLAGSAPTSQVRDAFGEAEKRVGLYLSVNPANGEALAARGWYLANLGQAEQALELVRKSSAMRGDPGEIAIYNAQTLGALGKEQDSLREVSRARAAGMSESRIAGTTVLRRKRTPVEVSAVAGKPL